MAAGSDTIFAVAAGGAGAALTIIRISGGQTGPCLDRLCGGRPPARLASLRSVRDGAGEVLDRGLVLWFPGPRSYTGEDCGELHLHGGRAVLQAVARALVALGARPAEPGEFTRRAFLSGRMDLTEAEGIADLVAADTEAQRRQALRQMQGELGQLYREWTARLIAIAGICEAIVDFSDEDDTPGDDTPLIARIAGLRDEMAAHLDDDRRGERVREGLVFAIVGAPNVGKSSLINALASRDVAIVSDRPGTTRDVVEARLELGGMAVTLLDTAGLRETDDAVESEGIQRARARAASADLVMAVRDVTDGAAAADHGSMVISLVVDNKIDLARGKTFDGIGVSAVTGEGIAALRAILAGKAQTLAAEGGNAPLTRLRHRSALHEAVERLTEACHARLAELRAEDVRLALREVGRITGHIGVEDVLDSVFSQFCIGK
jgi:tRNA modification GTPase